MVADRKLLFICLGFVPTLLLIAFSTLRDLTPLLLIGIIFLIFMAVGFYHPEVLLVAYAAFIPFEDVVSFAGLGTLTRILGFLFMIVYLITRGKEIRFQVIPLSLWLFFVWASFSMLWAPYPETAWKTLWVLAQQMIIVFLAANMIARKPDVVKWILWCYSCSAVITSLIAIQNFMTRQVSINGPARTQAFENQSEAHFAAVCVMGLLFCIYQLMQARESWQKLVMVAMISILSIAVLMSGTRSAWLGIIAALAFNLVPRMNLKRIILFLLIAGMLAGVATKIPHLTDFLSNRSSDAVSSGGSGRTTIWQVGIINFQNNPIAGVGIGNFPKTFNWDLINLSRQNLGIGGVKEGRAAHNIYLATLVEYGIIGFAFMLSFLSLFFRIGRNGLGFVIQAIGISYLVQGFFLDLLNRKYFWLAVALACGAYYVHRRQQAKTKETAGNEQPDSVVNPIVSK